MLDNTGFDLWAKTFDQTVKESDDEKSYPFAGYKEIINEIYKRILNSKAHRVLDLGFGTGRLAKALYDQGLEIFGQDFSEEMLKLAKDKMPKANLYLGNLADGLASGLIDKKYDAIVGTYSLHHLDDKEKVVLIKFLLTLLNDGGKIYIGDVAFESRRDLEACKREAEKYWDDDEIYFVYDEIKKSFPDINFEKFSFCAGLLTLVK